MSMDNNWIIGSREELGTPRNINAWLCTAATSCPETSLWKYVWDSSKEKFITTETESIQVECANKNEITLHDGQTLSNEPWLETMTKEQVDVLIKKSTGEEGL